MLLAGVSGRGFAEMQSLSAESVLYDLIRLFVTSKMLSEFKEFSSVREHPQLSANFYHLIMQN